MQKDKKGRSYHVAGDFGIDLPDNALFLPPSDELFHERDALAVMFFVMPGRHETGKAFEFPQQGVMRIASRVEGLRAFFISFANPRGG